MQDSTIRFIRPTDQSDTPYYNLVDLISFLIAKGIIRQGKIKPKRGKQWLKVINNQVYFHWATMNNLMPQLKKLLLNASDWTNRQSLFRKIYFEIDDPNHLFQGLGPDEVNQFFQPV